MTVFSKMGSGYTGELKHKNWATDLLGQNTYSRKFFDVVSKNILVSKLGCYTPNGWTTSWVKSCLHRWAQRVNGLYSTERLIPSGGLQGFVLGHALFGISSLKEEMVECVFAILQMTPSWWGAVCTREGRAAIQRDLDKLQERAGRGTSWNSTRTNAKSCPWDGQIPCTDPAWGRAGWAAALRMRTWGSWLMLGWTQVCAQRRVGRTPALSFSRPLRHNVLQSSRLKPCPMEF